MLIMIRGNMRPILIIFIAIIIHESLHTHIMYGNFVIYMIHVGFASAHPNYITIT